jgi:hypothetical protein
MTLNQRLPARRSYVHAYRRSHQPCRENAWEGMAKTSDCHHAVVYMWLCHSGDWRAPDWLGCGIHSSPGGQWIHDWLRCQYRCGSSPFSDGNHWLRVCPLSSIRHCRLTWPPSTRAAPYRVIINTLKGLPRTRRDAAFGLFGLFTLYLIRYACDRLTKRYPRRGELQPLPPFYRPHYLYTSPVVLLHLHP